MLNKLTISFDPLNEYVSINGDYPKPSIKYIPEWYKNIEPFTNGDKKLKFPFSAGMPNVSLKKCVPFLDAISTGYMAILEDDIHVEQVEEEPHIRWRTSEERITWHSPEQFSNFPIPDSYHYMVAKWVNHWTVIVPKNYSVLFSHPSNRVDLPFFTLSGLVNCGDYRNPVQFPFLLKRGFEGIIESGTPICQLHIIKNEKWKTKVMEYDYKRVYKNNKTFQKTFIGSYKKNFWSRQSYE